MRSKKTAALLYGLMIWFFATPAAFAFKIQTHVWLADQIVGELVNNQGRLNIDGVNYALREQIANAILQKKGAFLLGSMGADIYPDMFAGQMTTHPGVNKSIAGKPAWQTDDWVLHVIDEALRSGDNANIAFAAGYMLHTAMDMWAHSYVNLYAGDVFSIVSNSEVAERHAALESYRQNFTRIWSKSVNAPSVRTFTAVCMYRLNLCVRP